MSPEPIAPKKEQEEAALSPTFPRGYFEVQVAFAQKAAKILNMPMAESYRRNTALYRRILEKKIQVNNLDPEWVELMEKCSALPDVESVTNVLYSRFLTKPHGRYSEHESNNDEEHFGVFGFEPVDDGQVIKVHVSSLKRGEKSQLASVFRNERVAELKTMFARIKEIYPGAKEVLGGSWLYNAAAYRNLFPPEFAAHMVRLVPEGYPLTKDLQSGMSLKGNSIWGEFLNSVGGIKGEVADKFMAGVNSATSWKELVDAFPYPVLQPKCDIGYFYQFYGIQSNQE